MYRTPIRKGVKCKRADLKAELARIIGNRQKIKGFSSKVNNNQ